MRTDERPVIVGIDGTDASAAAVRAAAAEARVRGASLLLVHVVPDGFPLLALDPGTSAEIAVEGARVLADVASDVAAQAPDIDVEGVLRRGGVAAELAAESKDAAVLFLGRDLRRHPDPGHRANSGAGVAARAGCPVVVVPPDWEEGWADDGAGWPVVVGVKSPAQAPELLADAFAAAHARGSGLVVVHAWSLPGVYDDIIASRVRPAGPADGSAEALEQLLRDWRAAYPSVEVEVRVVHGRPARALLQESRSAGLLVLGHARGIAGALGGTVRLLLRDAACPVRVVPPGQDLAVPGMVLERARSLTA